MELYIDELSLNSVIEYFRAFDCSKPEQIGLFLYFKAAGLNQCRYSEYKKWGEYDAADRERLLRSLFDLSGVFDAKCENGLKHSALFPFSISSHYKSSSFYNGGTVFKMLGSRISDTLDNALVSTIIQRSTENKNLLKFNDTYIKYIFEKQLKNQRISLSKIAAWCFRFWDLQDADKFSERDLTDALILAFLKYYNISLNEYKGLFWLDNGIINISNNMISGLKLRELLHLNDSDCITEIEDSTTVDYMTTKKYLSYENIQDLLSMREGGALNDEQIIKILEARNDILDTEVDEVAKDITLPHIELNFTTNIDCAFERNRIVFGAPGTGKSYQMEEDRKKLIEMGGGYERVTFHPDYTYSNFVGCYKPVSNNGQIDYKYVPGPFMRVLVEALRSGLKDPIPKPYLLVIEEINRAKVAAVFGEVFQLLDRDNNGASDYEIHTSEDVKKWLADELHGSLDSFDKIRIPNNMFIWATMNSADQGVFPMDTAFKRRWSFEYKGIDENEDKVGGNILLGKGEHELVVNWNTLRKTINAVLAQKYGINEDKLLGPFFIDEKLFAFDENGDIKNPEKFIQVFKSKVIMYLYEDAAKQYKHKLFSGCDSTRYSSICNAFDEIGIDIFLSDFKEIYNELR